MCGNSSCCKLTSGCVQSPTTPVAFEVLGLLVGYENLKVVEVALTVEAPWPVEFLLQIRPLLLAFRHGASRTRGSTVEARSCSQWRREGSRTNARWERCSGSRLLSLDVELEALGVARGQATYVSVSWHHAPLTFLCTAFVFLHSWPPPTLHCH